MNNREMWVSATCKGIAESADSLSRKCSKFIESKSMTDLEDARTEIRTIAALLDFVNRQTNEELDEIRKSKKEEEKP